MQAGNKISDRYLDRWLRERNLEFQKEEPSEMPVWLRQQLKKELGI